LSPIEVTPLCMSYISFVYTRHKQAIEDLGRAIDLARRAIATTLEDCPNRAISLSNLSRLLQQRFKRTRSIADLNEAIELVQIAIATILQT
jgi:hypothetical protein